jgi:hypothetical protein
LTTPKAFLPARRIAESRTAHTLSHGHHVHPDAERLRRGFSQHSSPPSGAFPHRSHTIATAPVNVNAVFSEEYSLNFGNHGSRRASADCGSCPAQLKIGIGLRSRQSAPHGVTNRSCHTLCIASRVLIRWKGTWAGGGMFGSENRRCSFRQLGRKSRGRLERGGRFLRRVTHHHAPSFVR